MADRWLFMLSQVQHRLTSHIQRELRREGLELTKGQMGVLVVLERHGETTMGRLGEALVVDRSAITRLVEKLETRGLVERRVNADDRRQVLIRATDDGLRQAVTVKRIFQAANRRIMDGFSDADLSAFRRVNAAILERF